LHGTNEATLPWKHFYRIVNWDKTAETFGRKKWKSIRLRVQQKGLNLGKKLGQEVRSSSRQEHGSAAATLRRKILTRSELARSDGLRLTPRPFLFRTLQISQFSLWIVPTLGFLMWGHWVLIVSGWFQDTGLADAFPDRFKK
jgi:hypothetical protein